MHDFSRLDGLSLSDKNPVMSGVLTHSRKSRERVQDLKEMPLKCLTGCPDAAILIASKQGESNNPHASEPARVFIHLDNPSLDTVFSDCKNEKSIN